MTTINHNYYYGPAEGGSAKAPVNAPPPKKERKHAHDLIFNLNAYNFFFLEVTLKSKIKKNKPSMYIKYLMKVIHFTYKI